MSHGRRFDHVGLTAADLDVVTAFFAALGLEAEGGTFVEGEFLDTVCGIPGSRTEIVMLKPPGDGTRLELSSFVRPDSVPGSPAAMANELGLRTVAFEVGDLRAAVDWAAAEGYGLVGGIGEYEGCGRCRPPASRSLRVGAADPTAAPGSRPGGRCGGTLGSAWLHRPGRRRHT
jgi:catechol 2,3-dioxygenase-like lactoylglutathione lyase family enzyme